MIRQISPTFTGPEVAAYFGQYWDLYWLLDEPQQELLLRLTPAAFDNDRGAWATVLMQLSWLRGDRVRARALADTAWQETQVQLARGAGGSTAARPRRADAGLPGPEERCDRPGTQRPGALAHVGRLRERTLLSADNGADLSHGG